MFNCLNTRHNVWDIKLKKKKKKKIILMLQEAHMWNNNQWSEKLKGCHGLVLPSGQNGACGKENTGEFFFVFF